MNKPEVDLTLPNTAAPLEQEASSPVDTGEAFLHAETAPKQAETIPENEVAVTADPLPPEEVPTAEPATEAAAEPATEAAAEPATEAESAESGESETPEEEEIEDSEESEDPAEEEEVPPLHLPPGKKNTKQVLLVLLSACLVMFLVYASTSLIYKVSRGETWDPFAFLKKKTQEAQLPTVPTVPIQVLPSLIDETTTLTLPGSSGASVATSITESSQSLTALPPLSTESTTADSGETSIQDTTTAEITVPSETTTEAITTEETTPEETTTEATTTRETTTPVPTTPAPLDFTQLSAHLTQANISESQIQGSQLIIAQGDADGRCALYFFEKTGRNWVLTEAVPISPAICSQEGIRSTRYAGDLCTPAGLFSLGPVYGQAPSFLTAMPYEQIRDGDKWITDPASSYYNQLVGKEQEKEKDWKQAVEMSIYADRFKYAVLINYNLAPVDPGLGSAIFLQVQTDQDTDGSIGTRESTLFALLQWLNPKSKPQILIYSYEAPNQ